MRSKTDSNNRKRKQSTLFGLGEELYWDHIGQKAAKHVGRGDQLKGTVHEFAHCENKNLISTLKGLGEKCMLTAKKNAKVVDVVTLKKGKVIAREQLKDVVSKSGARDVTERIKKGSYRSAKIVTTKEGARLLTGKSGKKILSSGISSKTTTRVAHNQGANVRSKDYLKTNAQDIGGSAANAAAVSALFALVSETFGSYDAYKKGEISGAQYGKRITKSGAGQAVKSGIKTASALAIKEGTKQIAKASGKTALKRMAGGTFVTTIAFGIVEQASDTIAYASGKIDKKTYKKNSAHTAGSTGGAAAGAAAGAAIGSVVPGAGTVIGATLGGILGSIGGGWGAGKLV